MTAVSKTIIVNNTTYDTIANLADITLTSGKTYSIQIQNSANVKIADAEFVFTNEKFQFTQGDDDIYIKISYASMTAILTILENA